MPDDDDQIHLTVPADVTMEAVVVTAMGAVARSAGVGDAGIASARAQVAEAFHEVLEQGAGDTVTLTARAERHEYWFELHRAGHTYTGHQSFGV